MTDPSTNGGNGRDSKGKFTKGNDGGPGNPHIKTVAKFRRLLLSAISEEEFCEMIAAVCTSAKGGDLAAARFLISYIVGTPADIEQERRQILAAESPMSWAPITSLNYPHED